MTESRRTTLRWPNDQIRDFVSIAWFCHFTRRKIHHVAWGEQSHFTVRITQIDQQLPGSNSVAVLQQSHSINWNDYVSPGFATLDSKLDLRTKRLNRNRGSSNPAILTCYDRYGVIYYERYVNRPLPRVERIVNLLRDVTH